MTEHSYDTGDLGCADGLAGLVRDRLQAIPVGDVLGVTVRDPAARTELPALARLMRHRVLTIDAADGRVVIRMEKLHD